MTLRVSVLFSEPKIPQSHRLRIRNASGTPTFQCSSASRKFLNCVRNRNRRRLSQSFSALQRAENSSIGLCATSLVCWRAVSVLFSEPKIPQCIRAVDNTLIATDVSVLFSEPKIPQSSAKAVQLRMIIRFQCSSASRKFLNQSSARSARSRRTVSVLFSEPKIPQFSAMRRSIGSP